VRRGVAGARRAQKPGRYFGLREWAYVICLAAAFALNMSLNNFSLAFIPLSVNQVIRACTPLATAVLQMALYRSAQKVSRLEWLCMLLGVVCAAATVVARVEGKLVSSGAFVFGTCLCVASMLFGALDLVLKQVMGADLQLSPIDAIGRTALPTFLLLLVPGLLWHHPVPAAWAKELSASASGPAAGAWGCWTDLEVLLHGCALRPGLMSFVLISGAMAFGYNALTTLLAARRSATTASIIGNLPASTLLSLLVFEQRLPRGAWGVLLWASVAGNVAAFAAYGAAKRRRVARGA